MANAEHLEILKQGVEVWNRWREENFSIRPDLSEIIYEDKDLTFINFSHTNLSGSFFNRSKLIHADFYMATLFGLDLLNSNLEGANFEMAFISLTNLTNSNLSLGKIVKTRIYSSKLSYCSLRGTDLSNSVFDKTELIETDFSDTYLGFTQFSRCNHDKCIFKGSTFGGTNFINTDLSNSIGLDSVKVEGLCSIDFQTLQAFKNLPNTFLRKIGLPENYINYLPDFFDDKPIRMHPAFLSHSWADKPFASKLYDALIKKNVLVWYDERKLLPGDDIREGISKGIDLYDKFILVCSKNSLENSSWVDREIERAIIKEDRLFKERKQRIKTIIPIKIDDYVDNDWDSPKKHDIQRYIIGDFKDWQDDAKFEKALDALVAALNADRGEDRVPSYL